MRGQIRDNDLKLLRIFRVVAYQGGFSAAQAELNMTQPTISMHMAQLERRLGMRLCSRGNTGFGLTDEGKFILHEMEDLFSAVDRFQCNTTEYFSKIRGTIALGAPDAIVTHPNRVIVEIIKRFSQTNESANVSIEILNALELEERLIKGEIDVSFGFYYHQVDSLEYHRLFLENLNLYCGFGNVLFDIPENEMSIERLLKEPYVGRGHYEDLEYAKHDLPLREGASSMHIEGLALLILTGRYIGYLPDHYAQQWVERGEMRRLLAESLSRNVPCQMAVKRRGDRSRALKGFLKVIEEFKSRKRGTV